VALLAVLGVTLLAEPTLAQHNLQRTLTVDPSGNADFTTIQAAIDSIADNPTQRWTILIYAGVYVQSITLDGTQEDIDLVGVDRDAVVIAPTTGNGITITSGTETSRNNTIRNITINTTDGHGIEIVKGAGPGATTPKDIVIEDCVVEASGSGKKGVDGNAATEVIIESSHIQSDSDVAIEIGDDWTIRQSDINPIGVTDHFGLKCPIAKSSVVLQIARKASGVDWYTVEPLTTLIINVDFATVQPCTVNLGDSFEFGVLTSQ